MAKRLYKSTSNRMLTGVCGGIAEYFNIDPTIVRIIFVFASSFQVGWPLYILLAILLPYDYQVEGRKQNPYQQWTRPNNKTERRDVTPGSEEEKWDDF
ncbi:PspC family transcriptional regulator [Suicoccus acidiformans]|uniref:PspC family transcriptional regulator n=1 Tax=Suicoccus acidiformans TaxID=2036206 RepID=A0A347WNA7_9LACT|nr:PspC domain-containing protein [Suicoccus acidiformans]AXY26564.1 PspC family transcriptional regulator [Suicoccus acidiformans]